VRVRREALGVIVRPGVPTRLTVAALALACVFSINVVSADVWAYAAYGALIAHGADPWSHAYRAAEIAPLHDPLLDAALRAWDGSLPRDVYGPLFTLPCALIVALTRPFGPGGTILTLRLLAAFGLLACVRLAAGSRPRLATLLAFHPVVLWSALEGHNDVFWLALVLLADRGRRGPARLGALIAAAAVKAIALVPLAAAIVRLRARRRVTATAAALGLLVLAYAPLGWSLVTHGFDHGQGAPRISLVHAAALADWSSSPLPLVIGLVLAAGGLAAIVAAVRRRDLLAGAALAGWLVLPSPEPWYAIWLIPVVALTGRTPAAAALLAASFTGLAGYVPDVVAGTALREPALLGGTMLALYALPLLLALAPAPSPLPLPGPAAQNATPAPSPASTATPAPPTPQPSPSPNLFNYIVAPSPGPSSGPQIVEIALNDRVIHKGGLLLVRVTTSTDVTAVIARTMGHEIIVPQGAPGYFAGQEQMPSAIPFFLLNRTYQIEFIASTADGRSAVYTMPIRLER
jgi:hypothetical protein